MKYSSSDHRWKRWRFAGWVMVRLAIYFLGWWSGVRWNGTVIRVIDAVRSAVTDSAPAAVLPAPGLPLLARPHTKLSPLIRTAMSPAPTTLAPVQPIAAGPSRRPPRNTLTWADEFILGKMRFVLIAAGGMTLGPRSDEQAHAGITSGDRQRWVFMPDDYWIMTTELTQQTYEDVAGINPSVVVGRDHPVTNVNTTDAMAFVEILNRRYAECVFSLPTEDQLEYATRLGSADDCPFPIPVGEIDAYHVAFQKHENGDPEFLTRFISRYARFNETGVGPVAQHQPNGLGLYDMSGNVWEWCQPSGDSPPYEYWPVHGGGCSSTTVWGVTSAVCDEEHADVSRESIGFRLVVVPE